MVKQFVGFTVVYIFPVMILDYVLELKGRGTRSSSDKPQLALGDISLATIKAKL